MAVYPEGGIRRKRKIKAPPPQKETAGCTHNARRQLVSVLEDYCLMYR